MRVASVEGHEAEVHQFTKESDKATWDHDQLRAKADELEAQLKDCELQCVSEYEAYELVLEEERKAFSMTLEKEQRLSTDVLASRDNF